MPDSKWLPQPRLKGCPTQGATHLPIGWQMAVVTFPFLPALAAAHVCSTVYDPPSVHEANPRQQKFDVTTVSHFNSLSPPK
jgi:hypothetical protein